MAVFNAEVNGKKFTLETKSQPGQFDFKIVSDVNRLKNIEFLVKYEPTRVDIEFKWGPDQPKQSVKLEYENTDEEFELEIELGDGESAFYLYCLFVYFLLSSLFKSAVCLQFLFPFNEFFYMICLHLMSLFTLFVYFY